MRVSNKVALITGGVGGIGGATAKRLAQEGARVIVTDVVDEQRGCEFAQQVGGAYLHHDVSDLRQWEVVVAAVMADYGQIDILVNCAGIEGDLRHSGLDTTEEDWNRVVGINLNGSFWGLKTVMPKMIERGTGSVILLSSIVSYMSNKSGVAYGATKAAVAHLARSGASIGAQNGSKIRCNSVHPGIIKTRMTDNIIVEFSENTGTPADEVETAMCAAVPLGYRGLPEDVANMILYLASDESSYVTGSEFKIDAGWSMVDAG